MNMKLKELGLQIVNPESEYWNMVMYIQNCLIYEFCKVIAG